MKCGPYLKMLMPDGISLFRASKGAFEERNELFFGNRDRRVWGTDGLGVDWLSDDDCLKSIEGDS